MIWAEWLVGGLSVISADQIPYTQFGEDLKFQKKNYSGMLCLPHFSIETIVTPIWKLQFGIGCFKTAHFEMGYLSKVSFPLL